MERNAICQILIKDRAPIDDFIKPKSGSLVDITVCRQGDDLYIIFFDHKRDIALAYDVGNHIQSQLHVVNYGSGILRNGIWSVLNTNSTGTEFETQGGVATFEEIYQAIKKSSVKPALIEVNWP